MKLSTLNAQQATWLSTVFDRNHAAFAGARMVDEGAPPEAAPEVTKEALAKPNGVVGEQPKENPSGDELGEGGKKALGAEREARKQAEDQVKALKGEFDGFKTALLEGLGIKPKGGDEGKNALAAVQEQLAAIQRESSVLKLANEHKITDSKDLELLATAKDADSMKRLAERLAPKEEERDATSRRRVQPDRSQGGNGGAANSRVNSVAQVMADRAAARTAKSTQLSKS